MTGYGETALVRGLSFLAEKQASIANNLANVDTNGFKRRAAIAQDTGPQFHTLLDRQLRSIDYVEQSDMGRGVLRDTGSRFDVAIDGTGWFQVRREDGAEFYTRNGNLHASSDGHLVSADGLQLLDTQGRPIRIATDGSGPNELTIAPNGAVSDADTGQVFGNLKVVELPEEQQLTPVGSGLYAAPGALTEQPTGSTLRQGFLEGSNVDSLQELVAMITVERSFSATQRALSGMNQLQENLINNILR